MQERYEVRYAMARASPKTCLDEAALFLQYASQRHDDAVTQAQVVRERRPAQIERAIPDAGRYVSQMLFANLRNQLPRT